MSQQRTSGITSRPLPISGVVFCALLVANGFEFVLSGCFALNIDAYNETGAIVSSGMISASVLAITACWMTVGVQSRLAATLGLSVIGSIAVYLLFWVGLDISLFL